MSRLIALRQRISTVETIKKTTHAMRLISMSTHTALNKQKDFFQAYRQNLANIKAIAESFTEKKAVQEENQPILDEQKKLYIIIGSQKGLCGTFNTSIVHFFKHENPLLAKRIKPDSDVISVGKKTSELLSSQNISTIDTYSTFSAQNFVAIAHELAKIIQGGSYSHAYVYSNIPKTFFIQQNKKTQIIPQEKEKAQQKLQGPVEYQWDKSPEEILKYLDSLYIKVHLQELLFNSLLAEQAARFTSMDTATRNAEKMIDSMNLDYNKLRQMMITKELTDLSSCLTDF